MGAITGGVILLLTYTVMAPTGDIRARIPFLLSAGSELLSLAFLVAVFFLAGGLGLVFLGNVTRRAARGVAISSVACALLLEVGLVPIVLPEFGSLIARVLAATVAAAAAFALLFRERQNGSDTSPEDSS